jgi:hypothetical protein
LRSFADQNTIQIFLVTDEVSKRLSPNSTKGWPSSFRHFLAEAEVSVEIEASKQVLMSH